MSKFYLTTTLPYVNSAPHIGFALEVVQTDVIARLRRAAGDEVFFNTGTDEHGTKVFESARAAGMAPQAFADGNAEKFQRLMTALEVSDHAFIRTTDAHHMAAAQAFWKRCEAGGDIYRALYRVKYCTGCELEKTESELEGGHCPLHPNLPIEEREEENYFFKFSKYQKPLLDLYARYPDFVIPVHRLLEIHNFVEKGLQDFSISRLKEKMPWGIEVPGDPAHVMYVWFDALVNYISTLGWPLDGARGKPGKFEEFWGTKDEPKAVQTAGKDNLRQQAAMWQAMLLSAGLPTSRQIFIHGFITSGGAKMSKSLGNVVDPFALVEKYGADAVRYYLLREIPAAEDGDFSEERFRERYNADLANGIGNFTARVTTLAAAAGPFKDGLSPSPVVVAKIDAAKTAIAARLAEWKFHEALASLMELVSFGDAYVNEKKPWSMAEGAEKSQALYDLAAILENAAAFLAPFLPGTAEKISACLRRGPALAVQKTPILFPRLQ